MTLRDRSQFVEIFEASQEVWASCVVSGATEELKQEHLLF